MARSSGSMICSMSRSRCDGDSRAWSFSRRSRGWHEARMVLLVIAPLDLAAFGGLRVAGVAHVGRVALVAQQRPADLLAGAGELVVGAEEGQRMVDRHDRQVLARHLGDQPAPEAGADDHVVGHGSCRGGDDALDAAVLDDQRLRRRVGEGLELARGLGLVDQLAGDGLRARDDEAGVGVPQPALDQLLLDQRELLLDLGRARSAARGCRRPWPKSTLRLISSMRASSPTRATSSPPMRA